MSIAIFQKLITLFDAGNAHYRVLEHEPVCTSEEAAQVRGTTLGQGAKAMVCRMRVSSSRHVYVLAVFPGDQRVDFNKIAAAVNGKKAALATPEEVEKLTDCVMGAVPPVSFHPELRLIVDPSLLRRNQKISFNAGLRERSIIINSADYQRIVAPCCITIIKEE